MLINFKGVLPGDIMTSINNSPPTFIPKERSSKRKHLKWTHSDAGALCVRKWRPLLGELLSIRGKLENSGFWGIKKKGGKTFDGGSSWVWDVLLVLDVTGLCKAPTVYFNRLDTSRK